MRQKEAFQKDLFKEDNQKYLSSSRVLKKNIFNQMRSSKMAICLFSTLEQGGGKTIIVDGNNIAKQIREPKLAIILVGNAADSLSYVGMKEKACKKVGVISELIHLPDTTTQKNLLHIMEELNNRQDIDSILTQLPFPNHIQKAQIIAQINPLKDVDGLQKCFMTSQLIWDYSKGRPIPCTPQSCLYILDYHNIDIRGKFVVILGKGLLVGSPVAALLLQRGAHVQLCDKKSDISYPLSQADIVVAATGQRGLVKGDSLKEGVVIIDVGCSRPLSHEDHTSVVGDVDFQSVLPKASLITPVPGGVGPVTVSMLLQNVVHAWEENHMHLLANMQEINKVS